MTVWTHEASRRWSSAWIGGAGPFACVVNYRKGTSITLFRTLREGKDTSGDSMQFSQKRPFGQLPRL